MDRDPGSNVGAPVLLRSTSPTISVTPACSATRWAVSSRPVAVSSWPAFPQIWLPTACSSLPATSRTPPPGCPDPPCGGTQLRQPDWQRQRFASAPHPERKSVLIEANALFINDFPMAAQQLEQTFRQSYSFDDKNSSIEKVRNSETETGFNVRAHSPSRPRCPPPPTPAPGQPLPKYPEHTAGHPLAVHGYYYGFSQLPQSLMRPREADPRVGYFTANVNDFSNPDKRETKSRYIIRWRLEKKDPTAALSEPKQPIVYWLDKNIPTAYRKAVSDGILEWNKAYEKIGFKNAVVVKQQGDDDDFDTRPRALRRSAGGWQRHPVRRPRPEADPRTGEILDADIEDE